MIAKALLAHHRAYVAIRRSLRTLVYEVDAVREWLGAHAASATDMKLTLLKVERLSDAIVEDELRGLGAREARGIAELSLLINELAQKRPAKSRRSSIGWRSRRRRPQVARGSL